MQRRCFLILGLILALPAFAQANTITMMESGVLLPETAGQTITLFISGPDFYTDSTLLTTINGGAGPAPAVTNIMGLGGSGPFAAANLVGSVWAGGSGGILSAPNGTTSNSSGLEAAAGLITAGPATPQNTQGIYAVLTLTTVGVPVDTTFSFSLAGSTLGNGLDEDFESIPVDLVLPSLTLSIVPEPSSVVMGLFAAAGLAAVVIRRRRAA